jgi:A1 cistron-splicing factor AAR2
MAFVCLLMGQSFAGLEQWKTLLSLLSQCQSALTSVTGLFADLLDVLLVQLDVCPADFFTDILLENNFVLGVLKDLKRNINSIDALKQDDAARTALVHKMHHLLQFIARRFEWELQDEDQGEDAPVVVEL